MLKPDDFYAKLAEVGEEVLLFEQALILKPEVISIGERSRVDDFARLEGGQGLRIGRWVHISSFCGILGGGTCRLGDGSAMAQGSRIITGSDQMDACASAAAPMPWRHVKQFDMTMDHLSFVAVNSVVMPRVNLGVGAVLGAGSVATRPIPDWEIWAGVPAKKFAERDPDELRDRAVPVDELLAARLAPPPRRPRPLT